MDELCICKTPALWLWLAISRTTHQVVGYAFGDHTDAPLLAVWDLVAADYRQKPLCTDAWGAYSRLFPADQHTACEKGSGLTSIVEGLNTKWRQRQSGLVRRSCGVCPGITEDIKERFSLLVHQHNRQYRERWNKRNAPMASTPSNP